MGGKRITTESFIERAIAVHGNRYSYKNLVFNGTDNNVRITCLEHGDFYQLPHNHLRGKGCRSCSLNTGGKKRRVGLESFISRSNKIHKNKYSYPNTIYETANSKIKILCPVHGEFEQRASNHLRGLGCHKCSEKSNIGMFRSWDERIAEIRLIHGDKYEYTNKGDIGVFDFMEIICKKHGKFKQRLHDHLRGNGCRACGSGSNFRRSEYVQKCDKRHNGLSSFYVLKIKDICGKVFFKIGITVQDIKSRYSASVMPYQYDVVKLIKADAGSVFDLERKLKSDLSSLRYSPNLKFPGSKYECFTDIPDEVHLMIDSLVSLENE